MLFLQNFIHRNFQKLLVFMSSNFEIFVKYLLSLIHVVSSRSMILNYKLFVCYLLD